MLCLSECYARLGLTYAAKYYSSAALFVAFYHDDEDIKRVIPQAAFQLAKNLYLGGEWLNFIQVTELAMSAQMISTPVRRAAWR